MLHSSASFWRHCKGNIGCHVQKMIHAESRRGSSLAELCAFAELPTKNSMAIDASCLWQARARLHRLGRIARRMATPTGALATRRGPHLRPLHIQYHIRRIKCMQWQRRAQRCVKQIAGCSNACVFVFVRLSCRIALSLLFVCDTGFLVCNRQGGERGGGGGRGGGEGEGKTPSNIRTCAGV